MVQHKSLAAHYASRFKEFWCQDLPHRSKEDYEKDRLDYESTQTAQKYPGGRGIGDGHITYPIVLSEDEQDGDKEQNHREDTPERTESPEDFINNSNLLEDL